MRYDLGRGEGVADHLGGGLSARKGATGPGGVDAGEDERVWRIGGSATATATSTATATESPHGNEERHSSS